MRTNSLTIRHENPNNKNHTQKSIQKPHSNQSQN